MTWRVARSLDVLLDEINTAAPNRSTVSDGSIGDAAHATRDSDHNPWVIWQGVGVVRARDFTHDPAGGFDSYKFAEWLRRMAETEQGHPAMKSGSYIISNRRIWSWDRRGEGWRIYTGSNPHDHHVHVSVAVAHPGYDSVKSWGYRGGRPSRRERKLRRELAAAGRRRDTARDDVKTARGRLAKARARVKRLASRLARL